ncbi:MAG TPA: RNA 2',3'-cyclic phosphodiesterase, partial [Chloroflexota bacterium]|nr:RNA 2',3'-cyclic phosphodiesterase [Chloroflexota bacterium]
SRVKVKWVERENLHITLKFLGATPALMVPDLREVGEALAAELEPFELQLRGVGAFPKLSRPQTIVVKTGTGADELTVLAKLLHQRLAEEALLVENDKKPFVPHCTLGRVRQESGLGRLVEAYMAIVGSVWASIRSESLSATCDSPMFAMSSEREKSCRVSPSSSRRMGKMLRSAISRSSVGGPGAAKISLPSWRMKMPGAVPQQFSMCEAPSGASACLRLLSARG